MIIISVMFVIVYIVMIVLTHLQYTISTMEQSVIYVLTNQEELD